MVDHKKLSHVPQDPKILIIFRIFRPDAGVYLQVVETEVTSGSGNCVQALVCRKMYVYWRLRKPQRIKICVKRRLDEQDFPRAGNSLKTQHRVGKPGSCPVPVWSELSEKEKCLSLTKRQPVRVGATVIYGGVDAKKLGNRRDGKLSGTMGILFLDSRETFLSVFANKNQV